MHANKIRRLSIRDLFMFFFLLFIYHFISQSGMNKYILLFSCAVFFLLKNNKIALPYFIIIVHSIFYTVIGEFYAFYNNVNSLYCLIQPAIYLCSGFFSIFLFSIYKDNYLKLIDIQLVCLCCTYLLHYGSYLSFDNFYYESNLWAYIFGEYALYYCWQRRYFLTLISIIFLLLDHKRIATSALLFTFPILFIVRGLKTEKSRNIVQYLSTVALLIIPVFYLYCLGSGILLDICNYFDIDTNGRLSDPEKGTNAWEKAISFYNVSSHYYFGKGIGSVLDWLQYENLLAFSNLHNDFLAAFIELGAMGFVFWLFSFSLIFSKSFVKNSADRNLLSILIGYLFINFFTDNIYIYCSFWVPFYLLLLTIIYRDRFRKNQPF